MPDFLRSTDLTIHQAEVKLVVAFQKARRVDQVGFANRVQNVIDRNPSRQQLGRLGDDVELRFLSSLNDDGRNALEPVQAWLHLVGCTSHSLVWGTVSDVRL